MMDRRELLRRLGIAGLAAPATALVGQTRVPELVRAPAPGTPLLALAAPGERLLMLSVVTDKHSAEWVATPGEEFLLNRAIRVVVYHI